MSSPTLPLSDRPHAPGRVRLAEGAFPARGDVDARERFFDHYYDRVRTYVAHRVRDAHLAEDLTHEILLKVDAALARLDPSRDPSGWVFTVAANTIRDHWRRHDTRVARAAVEIDAMHDPPADRAARVDESIVTSERREQLHRALAMLSDDDQRVLRLRAFGELPTDEVARALSIRPTAARKRWSRAVRRLGNAYRAIDASEAKAREGLSNANRGTSAQRQGS